MKRHTISILLFSFLILLTALAITAIWTLIVPKFQAKAEVRVRPAVPYLVFKTDENGIIPFYDSYANTQVSIIRGPTVLQRVLDQAEVKNTQWCKNQKPQPRISLVQRLLGITPYPPEVGTNIVNSLKDNLKIKHREGTEIIDIDFIDASASDAKAIVKAVQEQYIQYIGKKSNQDEDKLYNQLVEEYKSLERTIKGQEGAIAGLQEKIKTDRPRELIASRRLRLDETEARLNEIRQNIDELEWRKKALREDTNNVALMASSMMQPTVAQSRNQSINVIGDPLPITQTKYSNFEEAWASVDFQLEQEKRKEERFVENYNNQQKEFEELFVTAQLIEKENKDLKHKRKLFNAVRNRLDQKNMERNVRDVIATVEVLTPAFVSSEPYNDRRTLYTLIALVLCLTIGSVMILLPRICTGKGKT